MSIVLVHVSVLTYIYSDQTFHVCLFSTRRLVATSATMCLALHIDYVCCRICGEALLDGTIAVALAITISPIVLTD